MKKLSLLLCVLLVISMLCSCQATDGQNDNGAGSSVGDTNSTAPSSSTSGGTTATTNGDNVGAEGYYVDVLEGLPYTMECRDYYMPDTVVEYTFSDGGRLNDGLYRSQTELENGTGEDKRVVLSNIRRYRVQITFEDDGTQLGSCLVLQNGDIGYFSELELGPDLDHLTPVEVETEYDTPTGMHTTELIRFEPTTIQAVRITLTVFSRSDIALDEIAILSPNNGGDRWTTTVPTEVTETTGNTATTATTNTTTNTTATTRPTGSGGSTDSGSTGITGRWIERVEGENVVGTVWYSFFDDGTGSFIGFLGLVTGTVTYTCDENNRYNITVEASMLGETDTDSGSGYMYVEGDFLHVFTDDDEGVVLKRMTDEEYEVVASYIEEKNIGLRF